MKSLYYGGKALLALPLALALAGGCAKLASDGEVAVVPQTEDPVVTSLCDPEAMFAAVTADTTFPTEGPQILSVCTEDSLTVLFTLFKEGEALEPVTGDVSFVVAKLVDDGEGNPSWQSYTNREEAPETGAWPLTDPQIQAATDSQGFMTKVSDGVFVYRFAVDVSDVTAPTKVKWEPELVHRVGLEVRGDLQDPALGNPTYTWTPETGVTEATARAIVANESCRECHSAGLELHGGARVDTDYCVLCHNPGSTDANSGNTVDMPIMIHKIHMGHALPSGEYTIWGHSDRKHDYSKVTYPQDQRNCLKCHNPADDATPDATRWQTVQNVRLCTSCHDDVSLAPGTATHPGSFNDSQCVNCHGQGESFAVELVHRTNYTSPNNPNLPPVTPHVEYVLEDVTLAGNPATMPVATFAVIVDGEPLDLAALQANTDALYWNTLKITSLPSLMVTFAAPEGGLTNLTGTGPRNPALDFNNYWGLASPAPSGFGPGRDLKGNPVKYAQPASFGLLNSTGALASYPQGAELTSRLIDNGDGTFTTRPYQLLSVPAGARNVAVILQGYVGVDRNLSGKTDSSERYGTRSLIVGAGTAYTPRRQVVSETKCLACHEVLALHGGNRINDPNMCVACHNGNATDGPVRPASQNDAPDGLPERTIAFGPMIHSIHTGEELEMSYLVYGYGGSKHFYDEVLFPANTADCETCHNEGTYEIPLPQNALAVTLLTGSDKTSPLDDSNVTPLGAACAGCHDAPSTVAHAEASIGDARTNLHGTESDKCTICHGEGAGYDMLKIHAGKVK